MKDQRPTVALFFGGVGGEREVSISGAPYLYSLIDKSKYNIIPILIEKDGSMVTASISDSGAISSSGVAAHLFRMFGRGGIIADGDFTPISAAIPLLHGEWGEDGIIQGALSSVGIPYIGCDGSAGSLCLDKIFAKIMAESLGIPVAKYEYIIADGDDAILFEDRITEIEEKLGYPMIVKPARLGSSLGIAEAKDRAELRAAIKEALSIGGGRVLIEERIDLLLEAECACLTAGRIDLVTPPGSVVCHGAYDYNKKYRSNEAKISPRAELSDEISCLLREYSARLCRLIGIRHLSRIDFFISRDGRAIFNEINTFPGFTSQSLYPRLISECGIEPRVAIEAMICEVMLR